MHKCSWSPDSSAGSTYSTGSHSIQEAAAADAVAAAVAEVPSDHSSQLSFPQSTLQPDGRFQAARVSTSGSSTAAASGNPALLAQPLLPPETCSPVAHLQPSTLQRSESLDQLQADCHELAGVRHDDLSADERAQQDRPQTARRQPNDLHSPAAGAGTSQPVARSGADGDADTDASVGAENTMLRQELARLRAEHVTTRIQCVLLESII